MVRVPLTPVPPLSQMEKNIRIRVEMVSIIQKLTSRVWNSMYQSIAAGIRVARLRFSGGFFI